MFKDEREKVREQVLDKAVDWGNDSESDEDFKMPESRIGTIKA